MLKIDPILYEELAPLLIEAIDGREFFSDVIYLDDEQVEYRFMATLMIYYRQEHYPEGYAHQIDNIVPIWWEFHSTCSAGEELNDFDFKLLKDIICS